MICELYGLLPQVMLCGCSKNALGLMQRAVNLRNILKCVIQWVSLMMPLREVHRDMSFSHEENMLAAFSSGLVMKALPHR
jgi:hypothetical protein